MSISPQEPPAKSAEFENYTETSKTYDGIRVPVGMKSLLGACEVVAKNLNKNVHDLRLLDVGCGTGNYIMSLKDKVAHCTGLEFNAGMLEQAKCKLAKVENVVLSEGSALELEAIEAGSFDIVIMTQVLHHLAPETNQIVFDGIFRVLKKGGAFWLQTCTPQQNMEGFWWASIIPQGAAANSSKYTGIPLLRSQLKRAHLEIRATDIPEEPLMPLEKYLDPNGPLTVFYRNGDSTWSLARKDELEAGLEWWQSKIDDGTVKSFIEERELERKRVGQSTCVWSLKN